MVSNRVNDLFLLPRMAPITVGSHTARIRADVRTLMVIIDVEVAELVGKGAGGPYAS